MSSQDINSRIAKLARINESVGKLRFEAVQDEDGSEWLVRIGIVRVVHSISEDEAKKLSEILNNALGVAFKKIIFENSDEIKTLIDSVVKMETTD